MDIDVELIKPLKSLINYDAFFSSDKQGYINSGSCFGAVVGNRLVFNIIEEYENSFLTNKDVFENCPIVESRVFSRLNLFEDLMQNKHNLTILPSDYFDPYDFESGHGEITNNTIGIHHYEGSWLSKSHRIRLRTSKKLRPLFGRSITNIIVKVMWINELVFITSKSIKNNGITSTLKKIYSTIVR